MASINCCTDQQQHIREIYMLVHMKCFWSGKFITQDKKSVNFILADVWQPWFLISGIWGKSILFPGNKIFTLFFGIKIYSVFILRGIWHSFKYFISWELGFILLLASVLCTHYCNYKMQLSVDNSSFCQKYNGLTLPYCVFIQQIQGILVIWNSPLVANQLIAHFPTLSDWPVDRQCRVSEPDRRGGPVCLHNFDLS